MLDFNFYHSGDLGDIIYSLPTIKELGGGTLHLGNKFLDKQLPEKKITKAVVENLRPILIQQEYIRDVVFTDHTNINIDYNLNKFRTFYINWENQKYTPSEINELLKK